MSLAVKFGDNNDPNQISGFLYFDAVTKYSKQLSAQVTSHPLDAGASITDHFISENPKYSIVGVISSADVSGIPFNLVLEGERPINAQAQVAGVSIQAPSGAFERLLSGDFGNIFTKSQPIVNVSGDIKQDKKDQIVNLMTKLLTGLVYDEKKKKLQNHISLTTLYSYDRQGVLTIEDTDLVITGFNVEEDDKSGDALFCSLTLEKVSFVTLEKTELPTDVSRSLSKAAQTTSKKGKVDSTAKTVGNKDESTTTDPGPANKETQRERLERSAREAREKLNKVNR